jgi:hypothetical protein
MSNKFLRKVEKLQRALSPDGLQTALKDTVNTNTQAVEDLTRQQILRGERSDGGLLPQYANPDGRYLRLKGTPKTAPGGRHNLKLRGNFQRSIKAKATTKAIDLVATDFKYPFLNSKSAKNKGLLAWNQKTIGIFLKSDIFIDFKKRIFKQIDVS